MPRQACGRLGGPREWKAGHNLLLISRKDFRPLAVKDLLPHTEGIALLFSASDQAIRHMPLLSPCKLHAAR